MNQPSSGVNQIFKEGIKQLSFDLDHYLKLDHLKYFNRYKIQNFLVPTDFFDVFYFYKFIKNFSKKYNRFVEIGGGSGLLSSLLVSNKNLKAYQIDIASYLLAQNLLLKNSSQYLLTERIQKYDSIDVEFAVNQDSFPEIKKEEAIKIIEFLKKSNVKLFFSNNHMSNYKSQTDFRSLFIRSGFNNMISFPNPIRQGYIIEVFKFE